MHPTIWTVSAIITMTALTITTTSSSTTTTTTITTPLRGRDGSHVHHSHSHGSGGVHPLRGLTAGCRQPVVMIQQRNPHGQPSMYGQPQMMMLQAIMGQPQQPRQQMGQPQQQPP
ncbi:hypothetical protein BV898_03908 [Hypsibius exemplaris]|uniref:Uncharacterized protein n=1 Tax=Hypsibius exemplaris TaxID=2072580 RepID=A0A1W0X3Q7_HYPEX|nr:hypothetical protein BV898_03908 [Hypsibius exemplaris]